MAASKNIVVGNVPKQSRKPILAGPATKVKHWAFSFRYWKQTENFGLGECDNKWFVSLLDRLEQMSHEKVDDTKSNPTLAQAMRLHGIDWNAKNIPICKSDIDWVASVYSDNLEEYPILQFQLSMATGRVVGFFDDAGIFNIILLDPKHNIQPAQRFGYKVDKTSVGYSEISSLLKVIDEKRCRCSACADAGDLHSEFQKELRSYTGGAILLHWDSDQLNRFTKLVNSGAVQDFSDLFEYALDELEK